MGNALLHCGTYVVDLIEIRRLVGQFDVVKLHLELLLHPDDGGGQELRVFARVEAQVVEVGCGFGEDVDVASHCRGVR